MPLPSLPNAYETWLIVKESTLEKKLVIHFEEQGLSSQQKEGAALGTSAFVEGYVQQKVTK